MEELIGILCSCASAVNCHKCLSAHWVSGSIDNKLPVPLVDAKRQLHVTDQGIYVQKIFKKKKNKKEQEKEEEMKEEQEKEEEEEEEEKREKEEEEKEEEDEEENKLDHRSLAIPMFYRKEEIWGTDLRQWRLKQTHCNMHKETTFQRKKDEPYWELFQQSFRSKHSGALTREGKIPYATSQVCDSRNFA